VSGISTRSQLVELLSERYPKFEWDKLNLLKGILSQQKRLERAIAFLFPVSNSLSLSELIFNHQKEKRIVNARRESKLRNKATGSLLEIDIYLPDLQLGFEFQVTVGG